MRTVKYHVENDGDEVWWEGLNEKQQNKVHKSVEKEKKQQTGKKLKFSTLKFKSALVRRTGKKREAKTKMMWRDEFFEWASTTPAGKLTDRESKQMWNWYMTTPHILRDKKGPRGAERCDVFIGDYG